jgi:hypothetical protein
MVLPMLSITVLMELFLLKAKVLFRSSVFESTPGKEYDESDEADEDDENVSFPMKISLDECEDDVEDMSPRIDCIIISSQLQTCQYATVHVGRVVKERC